MREDYFLIWLKSMCIKSLGEFYLTNQITIIDAFHLGTTSKATKQFSQGEKFLPKGGKLLIEPLSLLTHQVSPLSDFL